MSVTSKYYTPYQYHDGGRQETGYHTERQDCLVRAIAIAASLSYQDAHDLTRWHGRKPGRATFKCLFLLDNLFPEQQLPRAQLPATVGQFLKTHPQGTYICSISGHAFAVINGVVHDMTRIGLRTRLEGAWKIA